MVEIQCPHCKEDVELEDGPFGTEIARRSKQRSKRFLK